MNQLTEIIIGSATGILAIVAGMIVHEVKKYLIAKVVSERSKLQRFWHGTLLMQLNKSPS